MDRNTFTGLFLILIILVGSTYLMQPSDEDIKREKARNTKDSLARVQQPIKSPAADTLRVPAASPKIDSTAILAGPFGSANSGSASPVILENEKLKVEISPKGGRISSVHLKGFQTYTKQPLKMFEGDGNRFGLIFGAAGKNISTNDLYFTPSGTKLTVAKSDSGSLTMRLTYEAGKYIDYIYSLKGDSYNVGLTIATKGMQDVVAPTQQHLTLNWETILKLKEKDLKSEQQYSTAYYNQGDAGVDHLEKLESEKKELNEGKIKWISFKQHFFSNVLIAKNSFDKGELSVNTSPDSNIVKSFAANMQIPFGRQETTSFPMEFYFGPNKLSTLEAQGFNIDKQIDMGYWPLKYINRWIVLPVFNFLEGFGWGYGLIILVLTILLKTVLLPLTYKSYLSMAKMRVLKPEMDEIKAKVGDDNPTLLQQEYLKLYKKAGVNPLGGCLPMLLQLPIIMAFFFFFPNLFELRQQTFLWMEDLSTFDAFFQLGFTLPFLGNHISLMCILMTVSTLIYTYFNNQVSGATGQMKYIGYITPIIFFGVLNSYPSGLNYYYFLANMLTFAQQYIIRMFVNDDKIHAQIQENKKKPATEKKKSGFQQRMEDYMRQQQQAKKDITPAVKGKKK
ncbi:membrane protein insertase YidC [Daejeonella lutea]|uniref:Membrane protein insertase YidC n=1 Tax=Daejeonella lutea TaxID=572036 RepID=A0A1T5ADA4_9SPHI|nr:membrane protein insertase YidC [Daejeonella lutea]SKB32885.1 YidC/Oxa1 family membrane protein insertase [Daejeonella lutea]